MTKNLNPYSQHFRCMPRLLQNSARNDIFMFLLDEHLQQLHQKHNAPVITISYREIAEKAGVNRNIVPSHLNALHELHLIDLQKGCCTINANFLISVVSLFNEQTNAIGYQNIRTAFLAGDIERLRGYGLKESKNGDKELLSLHGTINDAQMCASELPKSMHDAQMCASELPIFKQLSTHLGSLKEAFNTSTELYEAIASNFSSPNAQICAKKFADMVFDAQICATSEQKVEVMGMIMQLFTEMTILSGLNIGISDAQIYASSCTDLGHRNKYIKENKKEMYQSSALDKEKTKDFEEEEEFFSEFKEPLKIIDLKPANIREHSETSLRRHQASFPVISTEEVDKIINDLEYAASSPLKLFINTVWWILSDYLQESSELEDDVEEDFSEITDIEGYTFPVEDFQKEILDVAYEEVEGYMNKGCIETDGGDSIPVGFTEMFAAELVPSVFKWEKNALRYDEVVYKISKAGIYDVTSERIEHTPQPETREKRRAVILDSTTYMTKLYMMYNSEGVEPSQLTPIERIAAECINDYLRVEQSNTGNFTFSINHESPFITEEGSIGRNAWRALRRKIQKEGYTESEFISCLLNGKSPNQFEQLSVQPCMFFAEGLRTLNRIHGHKSFVDRFVVSPLF